jgi:hypothetical protein
VRLDNKGTSVQVHLSQSELKLCPVGSSSAAQPPPHFIQVAPSPNPSPKLPIAELLIPPHCWGWQAGIILSSQVLGAIRLAMRGLLRRSRASNIRGGGHALGASASSLNGLIERLAVLPRSSTQATLHSSSKPIVTFRRKRDNEEH